MTEELTDEKKNNSLLKFSFMYIIQNLTSFLTDGKKQFST